MCCQADSLRVSSRPPIDKWYQPADRVPHPEIPLDPSLRGLNLRSGSSSSKIKKSISLSKCCWYQQDWNVTKIAPCCPAATDQLTARLDLRQFIRLWDVSLPRIGAWTSPWSRPDYQGLPTWLTKSNWGFSSLSSGRSNFNSLQILISYYTTSEWFCMMDLIRQTRWQAVNLLGVGGR